MTTPLMPLPGTSKAPKFRGKSEKLEDFLELWTRLAHESHISFNKRTSLIVKYTSSNVRKVLEGTPQFKLAVEDRTDVPYDANLTTNPCATWDAFLLEFNRLYDSGISNRRYTRTHLKKVVKSLKDKSPITSHRGYLKREQQYLKVAGWLLNKGLIATREIDEQWWKSLSKSNRRHLDATILAQNPRIDVTIPFPMADVRAAAQVQFNPSRFDADLDSDSDSESGESDTN